jgi:hypothetical protein
MQMMEGTAEVFRSYPLLSRVTFQWNKSRSFLIKQSEPSNIEIYLGTDWKLIQSLEDQAFRVRVPYPNVQALSL